MIAANLGDARLIARAGDRRLWLLDQGSAALWELGAAGWDSESLAGLLAERFSLDPARARAELEAHQTQWRQAGLSEAPTPPELRLGGASDSVWPAPTPAPLPTGARALRVADRTLSLACADPALARFIDAHLGPNGTQAAGTLVDHRLTLDGTATGWRLGLDDATLAEGQTPDAALVALLTTATELGCRPAERLLVIHGAGLVAQDGRGLLLVAPGGSGKSTLAAALDAQGYGLLSDDVVPVTLAGALLGLGLPLCLKAGSWTVLAGHRPALSAVPEVWRQGQAARILPPCTPAAGRVVIPRRLILSRYAPDAPPCCRPATPEEALSGIIAAESVVRALDQAKLDALARWVSQLPADHLSYPDLDSGLALVRACLDAPDQARVAGS